MDDTAPVSAPAPAAVPPSSPAPTGKDDTKKIAAKLGELLTRSDGGDRAAFMKDMKDLKGFAYDDEGAYRKMYADWTMQDNDFRASINRVAEYIEIFGSHLYPQNPVSSVVAQHEPDHWKTERFALEGKMLDYFMRTGNLETATRRCLNEAFLGCGVLWFGWNAAKNIPCAVFDSIENFGQDPDAKSPEEVNWIRRTRTKPRFELEALVGKDSLFPVSELKGMSASSDVIKYTEFYFRTDVYNYCGDKGDSKPADGNKIEIDNSPRKYILAEGRLLWSGEWEIPFFKIDAWPCRKMEFRLQPEKLWSVSPIKPGLCHLKAMNWIYTTYLNRVKRTTRMNFVRAKIKGVQVGDAETEQLMGVGDQGDAGIVDIEIPNGMTDPDVKKLFQQLVLDTDMPGFEKAWGIVNRAFEDATGMNDLMRSGQDQNQLRTAADVDFKASRSMTRADDMRKQFQLFFNDVLYSLAFTARFLMGVDQVSKLFGEADGKLWGDLGDDSMKQADEQSRLDAGNQLMQQSQMESQQAMQQAQMQTGIMPAEPPPIMSADEVDMKLGPPRVVTMDDWIFSARREIVAGSMRPIDHDAQVQNLNFFFQTMAPVIGQTPPGQQMNAKMLDLFLRLNRYDAEAIAAAAEYKQQMTAVTTMQLQQQLNPPPPPGMSPPGGSPPRPSPEPTQGKEAAAMGMAQ